MRTKILASLLMIFMATIGFTFVTTAEAGPPGPGFHLDVADLRYILRQIQISENHAAQTRMPGNAPNCSVLLGPGPFQIPDPRLPYGLRTVDGTCNNLVTDQEAFGSAFTTIPRLTTPSFRTAEQGTSYTQNTGTVTDSRPRTISNLIVDQTATNPAAVAAAGPLPVIDPVTGAFFIPNVAPDAGLSAPYNALLTFFGQFFDHGLTLLRKGGSGQVMVPLQPDDPLFNPAPGSPNFMVVTRATNLPGPNGILGDGDDIKEGTNEDTPWIDQNQTYTSHPSHQVFLRQYQLVGGRPVPTGRLLDGAIAGNIANWAEVKERARTLLGIALEDIDVLSVPLLLTDPYGHFVPGPNGFPQIVMPGNVFVEGNPATPVSVTGSLKAGTAFLCDIAHAAVPSLSAPYNAALLDAHFITGDCRGNENIALTAIHNVLHLEHNRLATDIDGLINTLLTPAEIANWHVDNAASGWGYGERLFQAARFVTEMEYQRIVIDTFARKVQPMVNPFTAYKNDIDPAIMAEFSHASYRFGHSMLNESVARTNADGSVNDIRLFDAFLNPLQYNNGGTAGTLTAAQAIGSLARGLSRQVGNEIDEFVTEALRNQLLGLPLDLPAINMTRGRSEGVAPLNEVRRQLFAVTGDAALAPYPSWFQFGLALRHPESLVNFVAAYGLHPAITGATTMAAKRAAANDLVALNTAVFPDAFDFMFGVLSWANINTGLEDVDLWVGGLAEAPSQFGGLLGSTNNFIFESQMEKLQDNDRFYYVIRLKGLNLLSETEQNSLSELIMRNSDVEGLPNDPFQTPLYVFNLANLGTSGPILDNPTTPYNEALLLTLLPDGTVRYTGPEHVFFIGRNDPAVGDRIRSSIGDDTVTGGAGNDRIEGGMGVDSIMGGEGDDILTDEFDDDVLMGGDGNDALSSGPGQGGDVMFGGRGDDFMTGSSDAVSSFAGQGDDFVYSGDGAAAEGIIGMTRGEEGDDWLEGGAGADGLMGDCVRPFKIDYCKTGDDVLIGGAGNDAMVGEGGNDIMVTGQGIEVNQGDWGFDWVIYKLDTAPALADLNIAVVDPIDLNFIRDRFKMVEALSGGPLNDILLGDDRVFAGTVFVPPAPWMTCDPVLPLGAAETTLYCHELTAAGIAKIAGLDALLAGHTLPTGEFAHGNILLGGPGSDIIMGRDGDDIIDGDAWLNVQLRAVLNDGTVKLVDSMRDLEADIFADPQRLNPGNITIVRSTSDAGVSPTDVDTVVFRRPSAEYTVTDNPDGSITVAHNDPACGGGGGGGIRRICDGVDTLRNIEELVFADGNNFGILDVAPAALTFPPRLVGTTSAPEVITVANISAVEITLISFDVTFGNPADFAITTDCSRVLAPTALCTISVTFTPGAGGQRSATLRIQSTDPLSPITIALTGTGSLGNDPPVITSTCPATATVGVAYTCGVTAVDPNGDTLTFSLVASPVGMTINPTTGVINWTPNAVGVNPVIVHVQDPGGLFAEQAFTITVTNVPPTITSTPVTTASVGVLYTYDVNAVDPNGDTLTFSLVASPVGMTINPTTGVMSWTPTLAQLGAQNVTVRTQDPGGLFAQQSFTITVVSPDTVTVGRALFITRRGPNTWRVNGTSLPRPTQPRTVTIYLGPTVGGTVIGTANVAASGRWLFQQVNSPVLPGAVRTISVQSSDGGRRENVPLLVR